MLTLFLMSNLYYRPHEEDGSDVEFEAIQVVVENERGARWANAHVFEGHVYGRERAKAEAVKLMALVQKAMQEGRFREVSTNPHWNAIQPCYGSAAYAHEWRKHAAQNELDDRNFEYNSEREYELREAAWS